MTEIELSAIEPSEADRRSVEPAPIADHASDVRETPLSARALLVVGYGTLALLVVSAVLVDLITPLLPAITYSLGAIELAAPGPVALSRRSPSSSAGRCS